MTDPTIHATENRVLVYGTLKKGYALHHFVEKSRCVGETYLEGFKMADTGPFPFVFKAENQYHRIYGEVYIVDAPTLLALDRVESHPHFYRRELVLDGTGEKSWVYLQDPPKTSYHYVMGGVWRGRAVAPIRVVYPEVSRHDPFPPTRLLPAPKAYEPTPQPGVHAAYPCIVERAVSNWVEPVKEEQVGP